MIENTAPEILMDEKGFFFNPEHLFPSGENADVKNARVEVRFHTDTGYISPATPKEKYPDWVKERLGIIPTGFL